MVRNDRCDPSSSSILISVSLWVDNVVVTTVFRRQTLLVCGITVDWLVKKVIGVVAMLVCFPLPGASFNAFLVSIVAFGAFFVAEFAAPVHRLV